MRDRSMQSGTKLAGEIKLTDWSMAGNLSDRSFGVQIPRDICTRQRRTSHGSHDALREKLIDYRKFQGAPYPSSTNIKAFFSETSELDTVPRRTHPSSNDLTT